MDCASTAIVDPGRRAATADAADQTSERDAPAPAGAFGVPGRQTAAPTIPASAEPAVVHRRRERHRGRRRDRPGPPRLSSRRRRPGGRPRTRPRPRPRRRPPVRPSSAPASQGRGPGPQQVLDAVAGRAPPASPLAAPVQRDVVTRDLDRVHVEAVVEEDWASVPSQELEQVADVVGGGHPVVAAEQLALVEPVDGADRVRVQVVRRAATSWQRPPRAVTSDERTAASTAGPGPRSRPSRRPSPASPTAMPGTITTDATGTLRTPSSAAATKTTSGTRRPVAGPAHQQERPPPPPGPGTGGRSRWRSRVTATRRRCAGPPSCPAGRSGRGAAWARTG